MGLTGGGPGEATNMVAVSLYRTAFSEWQTGRASALAYIVLVLITGVSNIYVKYLNQIKAG
jgi:multiple sugar transport system permease protein